MFHPKQQREGGQEQQEKPQDEAAQDQPVQEQPGTYYGDEENVELVDWEEAFNKHLEETRRMERERQEQIERAERKEKSWELLRECTAFIKQNEKN